MGVKAIVYIAGDCFPYIPNNLGEDLSSDAAVCVAAVSTVLCELCGVVCMRTPLIYVKRQCSCVCVQVIQL